MIKKRNPFVALLLSLFPGLGQIYNGQPKKASIFIMIDILIPVLFGLSGVLLKMSGLMTLLLVSIALIIYRMIDGFIVAKRQCHYELKGYNKWYYYWLFAMAIIVLRTFLDFPTSTGIQTYKISSSSMAPAMNTGDWVVAEIKENNTEFTYGDVVAFSAPNGQIWTFRVIGMPKDSIEIVAGQVYINGNENQMTKTIEAKIEDMEAIEFEETLRNKKVIKTFQLKNNPFPEARTFNKYLVPENEYFLLGDNRDDANDSRFIGTINKEDILGRIIYSYWGNTSDRINIDFRLE